MTKKRILIVSISILLLVVIGLVFLHGRSDSIIVSRALNAIDALQAGNYQAAEQDFHSALKAMKSPEALGQDWSQALALFGPLKRRTVIGVHVNPAGGGGAPGPGKTVELSLAFEKGTLYAHIPFDSNNEITGLMINQAQGET